MRNRQRKKNRTAVHWPSRVAVEKAVRRLLADKGDVVVRLSSPGGTLLDATAASLIAMTPQRDFFEDHAFEFSVDGATWSPLAPTQANPEGATVRPVNGMCERQLAVVVQSMIEDLDFDERAILYGRPGASEPRGFLHA